MKDPAHTPHAPKERQAAPAATTGESVAGERKLVQLSELLGNAQGINIAYGEQVYRLQITKAGKLILTK